MKKAVAFIITFLIVIISYSQTEKSRKEILQDSVLNRFFKDSSGYFFNQISDELANYIVTDSNTKEGFLIRGLQKMKVNNYNEALKYFNRSLKIEPLYSAGYFNQGIAKIKLNDDKGALISFTKAIERNPNFDKAYYNRGKIKTKNKYYKEAIKDFQKEIKINPSFFQAYMNLGYVKCFMHNYIDAKVVFSKAIELDSNSSEAYYNLGTAEAYLGNYDKLYTADSVAKTLNPNFDIAYDRFEIAYYLLPTTTKQIIGKPIKIGKLLVAQSDFPRKMNWEDAKKACRTLGKGWRLPTKSELSILYENSGKIGGQFTLSDGYYWSSSEYDVDRAWLLGFEYGMEEYDSKDYAIRFRAVRTL